MSLEVLAAIAFTLLALVSFGLLGRWASRSEFAIQLRDGSERAGLRQELARVTGERDRVTAERDNWYAQAHAAERRAGEADRRAFEAEARSAAAEARATEAERAIANGAELFERLDNMQNEMVELKRELVKATAKIGDLERQLNARSQT